MAAPNPEETKSTPVTATIEAPNGSTVKLDGSSMAYQAPAATAEFKAGGVKFTVKSTDVASTAVKGEKVVVALTSTMATSASLSGKTPPLAYGLQISAGLSASQEAKLNYAVSLPKSTREPEQLARALNPADPAHWPKGTIVTTTISTKDGEKAELGLSRKGVGVNVSGEKEHTLGSSMAVEALGNGKIRVSCGNSDLVAKTATLGVDIGKKVNANISSGNKMSGDTVRSVELDLKTAEGREAYAQIQKTGKFPDKPDPEHGITNIRVVKTFDKAQATGWEANIFSLKLGQKCDPQSYRHAVSTYNPASGVTSYDQTLTYGGQPALSLHREYDKDGHEIIDNRKYAIQVLVINAQDLEQFKKLQFSKGEDPALANAKVPCVMTLTYSERDMEKLMAYTARGERMQQIARGGIHQYSKNWYVGDYQANNAVYGMVGESAEKRGEAALQFAFRIAEHGDHIPSGTSFSSSLLNIAQANYGKEITSATPAEPVPGKYIDFNNVDTARADLAIAAFTEAPMVEMPGSVSVGPRR